MTYTQFYTICINIPSKLKHQLPVKGLTTNWAAASLVMVSGIGTTCVSGRTMYSCHVPWPVRSGLWMSGTTRCPTWTWLTFSPTYLTTTTTTTGRKHKVEKWGGSEKKSGMDRRRVSLICFAFFTWEMMPMPSKPGVLGKWLGRHPGYWPFNDSTSDGLTGRHKTRTNTWKGPGTGVSLQDVTLQASHGSSALYPTTSTARCMILRIDCGETGTGTGTG